MQQVQAHHSTYKLWKLMQPKFLHPSHWGGGGGRKKQKQTKLWREKTTNKNQTQTNQTEKKNKLVKKKEEEETNRTKTHKLTDQPSVQPTSNWLKRNSTVLSARGGVRGTHSDLMGGGLQVHVALFQILELGLHLLRQAGDAGVVHHQLLPQPVDTVQGQAVVFYLAQQHLCSSERIHITLASTPRCVRMHTCIAADIQ